MQEQETKQLSKIKALWDQLSTRFSREQSRLILAASGCFVFCFVVFSYLTFPWGHLRDFIIQEVTRPADITGKRRPNGRQLAIDSLGPWWFPGVKLEGVSYESKPMSADRNIVFAADAVYARLSLLSLLAGNKVIGFDIETGQGQADGSFSSSESSLELSAELDNLDIGQIKVLEGLVGLPVKGTASGEIDLEITEDATQSTGLVALTLQGVSIGDGEAKFKTAMIPGGMTIEKIRAGQIELQSEVENGIAKISRFVGKGKDMEIQGWGDVRLSLDPRAINTNAWIRFKFTEDYRNKSEANKSLFSLMDNFPQIKQARDKDGWLQYRVRGSGSTLRTLPDRNAKAPR